MVINQKNTIMENKNAGVVEMSKNFPVPVERLFEAWNEPEQLKQWWHPLNNHLENVKNELREGGAIEYEFQDHRLHIKGNYKEVNRNQKLVYSWNWELDDDNMKNASYTLSIDFIPEENGSRLQIRQEGFPDERATHPHKEGWDQGLASLGEFLEKQTGAGQQTAKDQVNNAGQPMESPADQLGPYDYPGQEQGSQEQGGQNQGHQNKGSQNQGSRT